MKKSLTLYILILFSTTVLAQELNNLEKVYEQIILNIDIEEELPENELFDLIKDIINRPIPLNKIETQIHKIPFLTNIEIAGILQYIELSGPLISLYEFNAIRELDSEKARLLSLITSTKNIESSLSKPRATWTFAIKNTDWKNQKSFPNFLFREKFQLLLPSNISLGYRSENDPNEIRFKHQNLFDFNSFYCQYKNDKVLFILGDFHVNYGQGLISWTGWSSYKNIGLSQIQKLNQGYAPYKSYDESKFYRGLSSQIQKGKFTIFGFHSNKSIDAKIQHGLQKKYILSMPKTGIHVTDNERISRQSIYEKANSIGLSYSNKGWLSSFYHIQWDLPYDLLHSEISYQKNHFKQYGFHWAYSKNRFSLFQELNWTGQPNISSIIGAQLQLYSKSYLSILFSTIHPKYFQFRGDFSSNMGVHSGKSIYATLDILKGKKKGKVYIEISNYSTYNDHGYLDKKVEVGLQFQTRLPQRGRLTLQFSRKQKREDKDYIQRSFITIHHYQSAIKTHLQIRSRLDWHQHFQMKFGARKGWMYASRINLKINGWKLKTGLGIYQQNKDAFYTYESSIQDISSFRGYFNQGFFTSLLCTKRLNKHSISLKYSFENSVKKELHKLSFGFKLDLS